MSSVPFIPEPGTENSSFNTTIVTVAASLSFAGCFFIIVTYIWLRLTHQFHLKCIFILSIVDLCISIVFLLGTTNIGSSLEIERLRPYVCHTLDTILHFLFIASFMWTACIAHMLLRVITYEDDNLERYHVLYHLISWGVAGGIVAILVARHVWFDVACDDVRLEEYGIVRFLFFIPLVVSWFYNIYAFVKLSKKLYKERKLHLQVVKFAPETGGTSDETPGIVHTHRLFLIAFAICWIWGILLSLFGFFNVHTHIGWIQTVNYAFTPLPGLLTQLFME